MSISWLKDVPGHVEIVPHENLPYPAPSGEQGLIQIDAATLDLIDSYDTTIPTSPSPHRIYKARHRKGNQWLNKWTVFICALDPESDTAVYHHPYEVILKEK